MDSRQLLQFRIIAQEENLQRAAEILYISPPALSKTLTKLEEELNCTLFNRLGKKIILNENGKKLLIYANEINETLKKVEKDFSIKSAVKPIILSLSFLWYQVIFSNISGRTAKDYSTLLLGDSNPFDTFNKLLDGDADIVIDYCINPNSSSVKYLNKFLLLQERYAVLVDKNHPWWDKESLTLADIEGMDFIDRQNNEMWRNEFMRHHNIKYNVVQQLEHSTFTNVVNESSIPILHMIFSDKSHENPNKKSIVIIDADKRDVYLWWLPENDEIAKPLKENIQRFYSNVNC